MTIDQTKLHPTDLQVQGDPNTGEVWLHYKTGNGTATSIQLSPKLLAETVMNLVLCAAQSEVHEVREVVQLFATRHLSVGIEPGALLVLRQEIECGLSMATTLERQEAERLHSELGKALEFSSDFSSAKPH